MAAQAPASNAASGEKAKSPADFSADGLAKKVEDLWQSFQGVKYGRKDSASRAFTFGSQFTIGTMAINAAQFLGAPLALINEDWHNDWIKFNKQQWGLLITTMTHWWSPTLVRVSGDKSVRGQISQSADGQLVCNFSERMMLIANHQIYTDWLYLWYIGYTNGLHGQIHVVMKESLKKLPFVGWGMSLSKFIFLKRDWEQDKAGLAKHLQSLSKPDEPMWLMFFPEGTNLAPSTREKSKQWAEKNGMKDMQHVLLPRSTGLHFCLLKLRETVDYVYDCTIAYEGVPRGEYAQDIFTLQTSWFSGKPPKSVNMHWRRFKIADIPLHNIKSFDIWLRNRWTEKDMLMERYMRTGRFPADTGFDNLGEGGEIREGAGHIETQVKPNKWYEILQVFAPIATIAIVLYYFYNKTLPTQMFDKATDWAGMSEEDIKKLLRIGPAPKLGKPKTVSSQALNNTLKPPSLQGSKVSAVRPSSIRSQSQASSIQIPRAPIKPASTYAGSISGMSRKETPSLPMSVPKLPTKPQTPQKTVSQITSTQSAAQKPGSSAMTPKENPVKDLPKQSAPAKSAPLAKASVKDAPAPKVAASTLVKATPAKKESTPIQSAKEKTAREVSVPAAKNVTNASSTTKKATPSEKSPPTQPKKNTLTPTTKKPNMPTKEPSTTKTKTNIVAPKGVKKDTPVQKPPAQIATPAAERKPESLQKAPKSATTQKNETNVATAKPATAKPTPSKPAKPKPTATKPTPTPTSKPPLKQETAKKPPILPKTGPRRPSIQSKQGTWSETTAVDDPFSERPSGKRAVKSQPTRKDRVKTAKKLHRQHLDHLEA